MLTPLCSYPSSVCISLLLFVVVTLSQWRALDQRYKYKAAASVISLVSYVRCVSEGAAGFNYVVARISASSTSAALVRATLCQCGANTKSYIRTAGHRELRLQGTSKLTLLIGATRNATWISISLPRIRVNFALTKNEYVCYYATVEISLINTYKYL